MIENKPSIYNAPSIYNQGGGGGGGGSSDIEGHIYPVIDIGYGTEFLGEPLQFIPKNNNFSYRSALDTHLFYNGHDVDYLDNYFSAPDSWRVPDENDLTHLKQYLDSNSIIMNSDPDFGSPRYYIDNNNHLQTAGEAYVWSKINNGKTYFLRLLVNQQYVIINTAPYNGAKFLVYLCRDKQ